MRARTESIPEAKTGRISDACMRYGVGRNTMMKLVKEANASLKIGRICLVNYGKMDAFLDSLTE